MTSIVRLVERKTAYAPEEVDILVAAFDEAWFRLCASDSDYARPAYSRAMREVVARRVVEVARRGVMDAGDIAIEAMSFLSARYNHHVNKRSNDSRCGGNPRPCNLGEN
jgi:hypothetical protein